MRTSLNEIAAVEQHLLRQSAPDERLVFEAQLIIDEEFKRKVQAQVQAYGLIQQYGRKCLKAELESMYQQLMHQPRHRSFMEQVTGFFKRK